MGGCYDSRSETRSYSPPVDTVQELLESFYRSGGQKKLFEAYRSYMQNNTAGFIRKLVTVAGFGTGDVGEIKKEFGDYELEAKLDLQLEFPADADKHSQRKSRTGTDLAAIMDAFEFLPSPTARFLKDASNKESVGINYFFGTNDGEERFVVIEKAGKWYLKEKGPREAYSEAYSFGIPGEELVMKRRETRVETNPLEVAKVIAEKYADGKTLYQGSLTKNRAEAHLLQTNTGRIYSLTVDELLRKDGEQLLQFEAEYAGYVNSAKSSGPFKAFRKDDEQAVVEDLVQILKQIVFLYNGVELNTGQRLHIQPTQERKFDFVSGRESEIANQGKEIEGRAKEIEKGSLQVPLLLTPPGEKVTVRKRKRN